jgi:hypothetical protein
MEGTVALKSVDCVSVWGGGGGSGTNPPRIRRSCFCQWKHEWIWKVADTTALCFVLPAERIFRLILVDIMFSQFRLVSSGSIEASAHPGMNMKSGVFKADASSPNIRTRNFLSKRGREEDAMLLHAWILKCVALVLVGWWDAVLVEKSTVAHPTHTHRNHLRFILILPSQLRMG